MLANLTGRTQVEAEIVHCCACCNAHLADHDAIISKAFQGRHGRAYLFDHVINVNTGPTENRLLLTGLHVVADIYCNACASRVGWKYIEAFEESQKYKEGKFILEKVRAWGGSRAEPSHSAPPACIRTIHAPLRPGSASAPVHMCAPVTAAIVRQAMILKEEEIRERRAAAQARLHISTWFGEGAEAEEKEEKEDEDEDEIEEAEEEEEEEEEEEAEDQQSASSVGSGGAAAYISADISAEPAPTRSVTVPG